MTVPVDVERDVVSLVEFPFATNRDGGIAVFHVVCLDIIVGVFATWAVDTLPIDAPVSV